MAKNKTNNNDLFSNFKAPKIDRQKEDSPIVEKIPETISVVEEVNPVKVVEEKRNVKEINPVIKEKLSQGFDEMAYAMPRSGRPKTLEGKYHIFTARIREDLFEQVQSMVGKNKEYQSVNDYLNRLIAKDLFTRQ